MTVDKSVEDLVVSILGGTGPQGQATGHRRAADCALAIGAVPYEGHRDLLAGLAEPLAGKIVVDCVNPLGFDPKGPYPLQVPEGSAAQQAAEVLPGSTVIGAFHHVSSVLMSDPSVSSID